MLTTTSTSRKLPGLMDSRHLFTMLFGPDTICRSRMESMSAQDCAVVASYRDNSGRIRRLLACDLAFANGAGAALSAIAPAAANNATKAGKFAENIFDNVAEVMNIAVNLFADSFGARIEFAAVMLFDDLAPELRAGLSSTTRAKFDVIIPRYDLGRVDLIAV